MSAPGSTSAPPPAEYQPSPNIEEVQRQSGQEAPDFVFPGSITAPLTSSSELTGGPVMAALVPAQPVFAAANVAQFAPAPLASVSTLPQTQTGNLPDAAVTAQKPEVVQMQQMQFETQIQNGGQKFESQIPSEFESQTGEFEPKREKQFESQTPAPPAQTRKKGSRTVEDPNKPPRVLPNTYWNRKGGGWVSEYKRKVKHKWLYEYYGLLKMETWENLKRRYQDEKLKEVLRGVILASRAKLQSARGTRSNWNRLRLVAKR